MLSKTPKNYPLDFQKKLNLLIFLPDLVGSEYINRFREPTLAIPNVSSSHKAAISGRLS